MKLSKGIELLVICVFFAIFVALMFDWITLGVKEAALAGIGAIVLSLINWRDTNDLE